MQHGIRYGNIWMWNMQVHQCMMIMANGQLENSGRTQGLRDRTATETIL